MKVARQNLVLTACHPNRSQIWCFTCGRTEM